MLLLRADPAWSCTGTNCPTADPDYGSYAVAYAYDNYRLDASTANSWGRLRVMYTGSEDQNGHLYEYDDRGQVVTEVVKLDSMPHTTTYGYDALGRVVTMTYPDGEDVSFTYDTLDRLVGASGAYSESYAYDAIGNLLSEGDTNYTYDPQSTSCPDGALSKPHAVVTAGMEALASAHAKAAPD